MEGVKTAGAPDIPAPFSQAIEADGFVFVSGQVPIHPEGDEKEGIEARREEERIVSDEFSEQARQVMEYIANILSAAGTSLDNVVKTTVFLTDMDRYDDFNDVYEEYMSEPYPARSLVGVTELAHDCYVEVEVVATK